MANMIFVCRSLLLYIIDLTPRTQTYTIYTTTHGHTRTRKHYKLLYNIIWYLCVVFYYYIYIFFNTFRSTDRDAAPGLDANIGRYQGRWWRVLWVSRPGESPVAQTVLAARRKYYPFPVYNWICVYSIIVCVLFCLNVCIIVYVFVLCGYPQNNCIVRITTRI